MELYIAMHKHLGEYMYAYCLCIHKYARKYEYTYANISMKIIEHMHKRGYVRNLVRTPGYDKTHRSGKMHKYTQACTHTCMYDSIIHTMKQAAISDNANTNPPPLTLMLIELQQNSS